MSDAQVGRPARPGVASVAIAVGLFVGTSVAVGTLLGLLSWHLGIAGLLGLMSGLAAGYVGALLGAWLGLRARLLTALVAPAIPLAFVTFQTFEDAHQLRAFRENLAETRAAASGLEPAEVERLIAVSGLDYLASDGAELLEAEVIAKVGQGGYFGRWLYRLDAGVRLGGPFRDGRGLELGRVGALTWTLVELALGLFIARRIINVARRRAGAG